ncbi:MAG: redoxin domain-containing protein [Flavobacteriales bacterium]|nr:redoxin domain-containing protein [Flavobacteriales bacterium]
MKTLLHLLFTLLINLSAFAQFTSEMIFSDIYGDAIHPSSILNEGKYIYLDFFSTTCGLCNSVADEVTDAYEYYGANNGNVFFLGVDYNASTSSCLNFASNHNSNFPIIAGQQGGIGLFSLFEQYGYPSGQLIHPSGTVESVFNYSQIANLTENLSNYITPVNQSNCPEIFINLNQGWNLVGFSCANNLDAALAFSPHINKLVIAKDYLGNAYLPEYGFNGIGDLERGYGYQLKIIESIEDFSLCNP